MLAPGADLDSGIYSNRYAIEPLVSVGSFGRHNDGSSCQSHPRCPTECNYTFDDELIAALSVWSSLLSHFRYHCYRQMAHSSFHWTHRPAPMNHRSANYPIVVAYSVPNGCLASTHTGMHRMSSLANWRRHQRAFVAVATHNAHRPHSKMTCMEIINSLLREHCYSTWAAIVQSLILIVVLVLQLIDYWQQLTSIVDLNAAPIGSANQWHGLIKYQRRLLRVSICWDLTWFFQTSRVKKKTEALQDEISVCVRVCARVCAIVFVCVLCDRLAFTWLAFVHYFWSWFSFGIPSTTLCLFLLLLLLVVAQSLVTRIALQMVWGEQWRGEVFWLTLSKCMWSYVFHWFFVLTRARAINELQRANELNQQPTNEQKNDKKTTTSTQKISLLIFQRLHSKSFSFTFSAFATPSVFTLGT